MDRKKYLELCQQNSMRPKSSRVRYKGIYFYPTSYTLSFKKDGTAQHTAILMELQANSVVHADLKQVEG
jgi:hypothetical protein